MTKEQFFNLSAEQRRSLIKRAHTYYASPDFKEDLNKVTEKDVREFIEMCIKERNAQALRDASMGNLC